PRPDPPAIAFVRAGRVATIVPRLPHTRKGEWDKTLLRLPPGAWRDVFANGELAGERDVSLAEIWSEFPVALLVRL
ncbi:hypothetical protein K8I61_10790, partial [bacterium]|nr:hypothetical protein [bacterium]